MSISSYLQSCHHAYISNYTVHKFIHQFVTIKNAIYGQVTEVPMCNYLVLLPDKSALAQVMACCMAWQYQAITWTNVDLSGGNIR